MQQQSSSVGKKLMRSECESTTLLNETTTLQILKNLQKMIYDGVRFSVILPGYTPVDVKKANPIGNAFLGTFETFFLYNNFKQLFFH